MFIKLLLGCLHCDWDNSFRSLRGIFNVLLQTMKKITVIILIKADKGNLITKGSLGNCRAQNLTPQFWGFFCWQQILSPHPLYSPSMDNIKISQMMWRVCNPPRNEPAWEWQVLDLNLAPGFQLLTAYTAKVISTVLKSVCCFAWWHMPAQKWTKGRI